MLRFLRQLLSSTLVLISVIVLVASIIYLAPVDPVRLTFGQRSDSGTVERKKAELYLDQPLPTQMLYYLNDVSPISYAAPVRYDQRDIPNVSLMNFGEKALLLKVPYLRESYQTGESVWQLLKRSIPKTLILALAAMLIAVALGLLLGSIAALFKDTWIDQFIISITVLGISVPSYVSAIVLALIFGYWLRDFTGLNIQGSIFDLDDMGNEIVVLKNLILPAIALGIRPLSIITQLMRSSLLDVLSQDYVRTATAKGIAFKKVVRRHAVKNALNPVITAVTGWFASLLAGAFFVENVFNFKGVGDLTVNALINYDIPVLLACIIFICLVFIVINLIVDASYKLFDPKVKA